MYLAAFRATFAASSRVRRYGFSLCPMERRLCLDAEGEEEYLGAALEASIR